MSDYSHKRVGAFRKIDLRNVITMLQLLTSLRLRRKSFVRSRFEESAQHFDETLIFLRDIGLITTSGETLTVADNSPPLLRWPPDPKTTRYITNAILAADTLYRIQLCNFLAQFECDDDAIVYAPGTEQRVQESAIRNFAIALELVHLRRRTNDYAVNGSVVDLWIRARARHGPKTKRNLARRRREREELGFAAECAVFEYEKRRLGKRWLDHVHHVSEERPLAVYDIESVTLAEVGPNPRFIEVKAVSPESFRFFWSKEEVDTARFLRDAYFLYLVPVRPSRGIDISELRIVEDAYTNVYKNHSQWDIESDVVLCQLRRLSVS